MYKKEHLVLVVDDDAITVVVLEKVLQNAGLETLKAHNLADTEALLRKHRVSLILLDVHLPDGNGLDFCQMFTSVSDTPVLFISEDNNIDTKKKGFDAGAVDYITKPLMGVEVLARVKTHLKLKAAYDELQAMHADRIQSLGSIQNRMMPLPMDLPDARFQVGLRQIQQAGGDFYDVIPLGNGIVDYIVADVCGHDIAASLWTAAFKSLLGEFATLENKPLDVCRMLNNALRRIMPGNAYFTVLYARLNRNTGGLTLVNAGHPPAVLADVQRREVAIIEQDGDLLGAFDDAAFGVHEQAVKPGDRLYLFTDGLIEQAGTREEGVRRLIDVCRSSLDESLDDSVFFALASVCITKEMDDDVVLMGVEV